MKKKGSGSQTFYVAGPNLAPHIDFAIDTLEPVLQDRVARLQDWEKSKIELPQNNRQAFNMFPQKLKEKITKTALTKRSPPDALRSIIVEICSFASVSASELAEMLSRTQEYISQDYLTPMVQEGILQQTISGTPNHPDQRYKVSQ